MLIRAPLARTIINLNKYTQEITKVEAIFQTRNNSSELD